ncbi:hypothetical protein BJY00DRAFT_313579 [Aspergillus carlsbadensis]|nr:hypothetical protein BJY00DRAFT_313579 [Aspergillus carlsbadensis]
MSFTQDSHDDYGQGPEGRFRWEQHLLGLDDDVQDPDVRSDHEREPLAALGTQDEGGRDDNYDDPQTPEEDLCQATTPLHEPEPSNSEDEISMEIQRTTEPVLTVAFTPNDHGELYRTYRSTSTFMTVDVCIWVEPPPDRYSFRGATIGDLTAQVPVPGAGDIVRGFWIQPHDGLLTVGCGRIVDVVYKQEIYLVGVVLR